MNSLKKLVFVLGLVAAGAASVSLSDVRAMKPGKDVPAKPILERQVTGYKTLLLGDLIVAFHKKELVFTEEFEFLDRLLEIHIANAQKNGKKRAVKSYKEILSNVRKALKLRKFEQEVDPSELGPTEDGLFFYSDGTPISPVLSPIDCEKEKEPSYIDLGPAFFLLDDGSDSEVRFISFRQLNL